MSKFVYVAKDGKGKEVKGTLEAASPAQAQEMLRQNGLFPTKLGQAKAGSMEINIKLPAFLRPKVKTKDLCILTRQLATLVEAFKGTDVHVGAQNMHAFRVKINKKGRTEDEEIFHEIPGARIDRDAARQPLLHRVRV